MTFLFNFELVTKVFNMRRYWIQKSWYKFLAFQSNSKFHLRSKIKFYLYKNSNSISINNQILTLSKIIF